MRFLFLVLTLVLCAGGAFGSIPFWLNLLGLAPPPPVIPPAPVINSRVVDTQGGGGGGGGGYCAPPNCMANWAYKK